jgi:hypothetical protein
MCCGPRCTRRLPLPRLTSAEAMSGAFTFRCQSGFSRVRTALFNGLAAVRNRLNTLRHFREARERRAQARSRHGGMALQ